MDFSIPKCPKCEGTNFKVSRNGNAKIDGCSVYVRPIICAKCSSVISFIDLRQELVLNKLCQQLGIRL